MSDMAAAIDLAPSNPYGLIVSSPVIVAPGCAVGAVERARVGAIVTRTATRHTRHGPAPRFAATPAGMVVSELPSVSIRTLMKEETRRWERLSPPILVSLQGDEDELGEMARMLDEVESIAGLVLIADGPVAVAMRAVRRQTHRPVLASLPLDADIGATAAEVVAAGADGLIVTQPPRGVGGSGEPVSGHLLGPAAFPLTYRCILEARGAVTVPIIAWGGIATVELARTLLDAGANAVMVDAARWGDPEAPMRLADGLRSAPASA